MYTSRGDGVHVLRLLPGDKPAHSRAADSVEERGARGPGSCSVCGGGGPRLRLASTMATANEICDQ